MHLRNSPIKWAFLLPGVVVMILITVVPISQAAVYSFQEWNLTRSPVPTGWVGFDNYLAALTDPNFWNAIRITTIYTAGTVVASLIIGLWVAIALKKPSFWGGFLKTTLIFPFAVPLALRGYSFRFMLVEGDGVLDVMIGKMLPALADVAWMNDPGWALFWVSVPTFWAWGPLCGLMLLGALNNIPNDIFEAADLDGAGPFRTFFSITAPLLRPMLMVVALLVTLFSVAMFDLVQTMTKGGPGRATETLNYFIYRVGFGQFDVGYASAMAIILTLVLSVMAYVYTRVLKL